MEKTSKEIKKIEKCVKRGTKVYKELWLTAPNQVDETATEHIKATSDFIQNSSTVKFWHISRFFRVLLKECPAIYYYLYSRGYLGEVKQLLNFAFYEGMKYQQGREEPANENYK
ncbi:hypothetical protein [Eubacterium sp.]|uniref:hypothetical protein n=1 Tax=Eubacterium sp. TaxID=142586 RepID=UPI00399BD57D